MTSAKQAVAEVPLGKRTGAPPNAPSVGFISSQKWLFPYRPPVPASRARPRPDRRCRNRRQRLVARPLLAGRDPDLRHAGRGGHPLTVLTVTYAGGRTRQFSLRGEQVDQVRRWLGNYHKLKAAIEAICELNQALLRPEDAGGARSRTRD